jgi:hypothetical protein
VTVSHLMYHSDSCLQSVRRGSPLAQSSSCAGTWMFQTMVEFFWTDNVVDDNGGSSSTAGGSNYIIVADLEQE